MVVLVNEVLSFFEWVVVVGRGGGGGSGALTWSPHTRRDLSSVWTFRAVRVHIFPVLRMTQLHLPIVESICTWTTKSNGTLTRRGSLGCFFFGFRAWFCASSECIESPCRCVGVELRNVLDTPERGSVSSNNNILKNAFLESRVFVMCLWHRWVGSGTTTVFCCGGRGSDNARDPWWTCGRLRHDHGRFEESPTWTHTSH